MCLARLPDGKVHCEVLTRPELGSVPSERKWKPIKEVGVSADALSSLESKFATPELKRSAEKDCGPHATDGTRWCLKKKKGSFSIEIVAHNPDMRAEGVPMVQLAHAISAVASTDIFPK